MNSMLSPLLLAASDHGGHTVIYNISLCIVAASVLGLICRLARQPVMLGHLLAGVLLGPIGLQFITDHTEIVTISEIGLILLLFMIGLEIDLHRMLSAGKWIIVPGLMQFPICVGLGWGLFTLLDLAGISFGSGPYVTLYCGIIISISSTMIVVKLLYEKMELDTLPGRITVGVLVFQDIWAIIVLAIQPNLANPQILDILGTFGSGAVLIAAALGFSKFVLPHAFRLAATSSELMLVLALGWCFLVSLVAAHPLVGLSMEMGALIAGVSLATFPYSGDVIGKVTSIRDFFITLFFVSLAMQIPLPEVGVLLRSLLIAATALATRAAGIYVVLYSLKAGHRVSLLSAINLGQISEFGLVIVSIGIGLKHVDEAVLTHIIWVFSILAIASTYLVKFNDSIQRNVTRRLVRAGLRDVANAPSDGDGEKKHYPIVFLGFYRIASAVLHDIRKNKPDLVHEIKIVDTNPIVKSRLDGLGIQCVYGDISHKDSLEHAHIHDAKVIVCSIPDHIIKGTTNGKLLESLRRMCPDASIIVTAENTVQARSLYSLGADYVIQSAPATSPGIVTAISRALDGSLDGLRAGAIRELSEREEVLA